MCPKEEFQEANPAASCQSFAGRGSNARVGRAAPVQHSWFCVVLVSSLSVEQERHQVEGQQKLNFFFILLWKTPRSFSTVLTRHR